MNSSEVIECEEVEGIISLLKLKNFKGKKHGVLPSSPTHISIFDEKCKNRKRVVF